MRNPAGFLVFRKGINKLLLIYIGYSKINPIQNGILLQSAAIRSIEREKLFFVSLYFHCRTILTVGSILVVVGVFVTVVGFLLSIESCCGRVPLLTHSE